MTLVACSHCSVKYRGVLIKRMLGYYDDAKALTYGMSRRDRARICTLCTKAEALADYMGITDEMARIAIGNDHQDALRLPEGGLHTYSFGAFQTGGLDKWIEGHEEVYPKRRSKENV